LVKGKVGPVLDQLQVRGRSVAFVKAGKAALCPLVVESCQIAPFRDRGDHGDDRLPG
jgi:hypothetical protein